MGFKHIKFFFFASFTIILTSINVVAQKSTNEQHIEVSMRMIGHKVLLNFGDSISRVMPIEKEEGQYRIKFDTEFGFDPEELVATVNQVVRETSITDGFIVGVENCETKEVVYSYEMNNSDESDIAHCASRTLPKACYNLLFTLLDSHKLGVEEIGTSKFKGMTIPLIALMSVFLIGLYFFLSKRRSKQMINPNVIQLGDYQFDKRNTELLWDQQRIELTSKEADLLILLYDAVNTTMEREVILRQVWGDEGDYVGRTLDVFISKLRKKLESDPKVKIVNIRGVGYKLVMDV